MAASPEAPAPKNGRTILLIEDDPSIALGLELNLKAEGYEVDVAMDGETGLDMARRPVVDLLILDLMLPRVNGFEIVRRLRAEGRSVPIILLSARGAETDKVMGLDLGAEDYVTKPFGLSELLARVKAVLRRDARSQTPNVLTSGPVTIDRSRHEVYLSGRLVEMTATELEILWCLVEANGRVLSRDQILAKVWGEGHHGTLRTIDNFILQLRAKIEEDAAKPKHIITVRGVGYRFLPM